MSCPRQIRQTRRGEGGKRQTDSDGVLHGHLFPFHPHPTPAPPDQCQPQGRAPAPHRPRSRRGAVPAGHPDPIYGPAPVPLQALLPRCVRPAQLDMGPQPPLPPSVPPSPHPQASPAAHRPVPPQQP